MLLNRKIEIRSTVSIPIRNGWKTDFITFAWKQGDPEHFAVRFERPATSTNAPLVRVHSECMTGDLFGSMRCDCGAQLNQSLELLNENGGFLLYMRQEGRGIGLGAKLEAYQLQDLGLDTFAANRALSLPADARDYGSAAAMLYALGQHEIRLLTNNPDKVANLRGYGIQITSVQPTGTFLTEFNKNYLAAKVAVAGHHLNV